MRLNNNVVNNLANVTPTQTVCATTALSNVNSSGNAVIQTQAANACIKKDLSNLTTAQKHAIVDLCAPSGITVDLGANVSSGTTFTAGSTGWVEVRAYKGTVTGPGFLALRDMNNYIGTMIESNTNAQYFYASIPTVRGHTVALYFNNISSDPSGSQSTQYRHPASFSFIQAGGG